VGPEEENHSILANRDREDKLMAERLLQNERKAMLVDEAAASEKFRAESEARKEAEMKLQMMEQRFNDMKKEHAEKDERLRIRKEKAALAKQKKDEKKAALAKQKKEDETNRLRLQKQKDIYLTRRSI